MKRLRQPTQVGKDEHVCVGLQMSDESFVEFAIMTQIVPAEQFRTRLERFKHTKRHLPYFIRDADLLKFPPAED